MKPWTSLRPPTLRGIERWWSTTRYRWPRSWRATSTREMFDVTLAHNGADALSLAREIDPDVVVLDLALPGIDGLEVCRQLRTFSDAYVVMLTARDTELDTIVGLSVGADDYVTKPFSPRELVARIRAMLRRPRTVASPVNATAATAPLARGFGPLSHRRRGPAGVHRRRASAC